MLHFCGKTSNAGVQANTPLSDHLETITLLPRDPFHAHAPWVT